MDNYALRFESREQAEEGLKKVLDRDDLDESKWRPI